jgi:hypothetical protein
MNSIIEGAVRNGLPSIPEQMFDTGDDFLMTGYVARNVTAWGKPNSPVKKNRKRVSASIFLHPIISSAILFVVMAGIAFMIGVQCGRHQAPASIVLGETAR